MPMTDEEIREMFKQQEVEFDRRNEALVESLARDIRKHLVAAFAQQVERPPTTAPHFRLPKGFNLARHQHVALCSHCAGGLRPVWFVAPGQCPACCTPAPTNPRVSEGAEYGYAVRHDDLLTFKPGDVVSTDGRQLVYCLPCAAVKGRVVWFTAPGRCPVCKTPCVGDNSAPAKAKVDLQPEKPQAGADSDWPPVALRRDVAYTIEVGEFFDWCRHCVNARRRILFIHVVGAPNNCPVCSVSAHAAPQGELRPASGTMVTLRPMSAIELADGEFMARCRACTKEGRRIWFVCRRDEPTGMCPCCGSEQPLYEQTL